MVLKKKSLLSQLSTLLILSIFLSALFVFYKMGATIYKNEIKNSLNNQYLTNNILGDRVENKITYFIGTLKNKSDTLSILIDGKQSKRFTSISKLISNITKRESAISEVLVLDKDGNVLALAEPMYDYNSYPILDRSNLKDLAFHFFDNVLPTSSLEFNIAESGRLYISPGHLHEEDVTFNISYPIDSPSKGVVISRISVKGLFDDINFSNLKSEVDNFYIIDNKGVLLYSSSSRLENDKSLFTHLDIIRKAIVGEKWDTSKPYIGVSGVEVYGTVTQIPSLNWSFISEVKVSEVLKPIWKTLLEILVIVALGSLILFMFIRKLLSKSLAPIFTINKGIKKVSDGNRHHVIPEFEIKEFDIIGTSFNSMLDDLNKKESLIIHKSKLASIGELSAGVGHEINNPLTISIGNIELLKKELIESNFDTKIFTKKIEVIELAHKRIKNIVDGLRTYSRADDEEKEIISFDYAVDQTFNLVQDIYESDGIVIEKSIPDTKIYLKANLGKLQQVILNLITNAKDATVGQEKRIIHLKLQEINKSSFLFSVTDNGIGIPEDVRDKIFNPFFTTKKIGEGTGMGLGFVSEIVKGMNGKLSVESKLNEGTKFTIIFPKASEQVQIREKIIKQKQEQLTGTALVVDDEPGIRRLLTRLLEDMGIVVDQADDGDTALEKVKAKKYDYICTDMKMKRMQGMEFIKEARKLPNGDTHYFIITGGVTTNYADKIHNENELAVAGYLTKPFTQKDLYNILHNASNNPKPIPFAG